MESKDELQKRLFLLETTNAELISELTYIDNLMRRVGFPNGIKGLKETAQEYCQECEINPYEEII